MSVLTQFEATALTGLADFLETNAATLEADLGPFEVVLINDAVKLGDPIWAKLPFGLGGLIDAAFAKYAPLLEGGINQFVGQGVAAVVAFLRAAAAKAAAAGAPPAA